GLVLLNRQCNQSNHRVDCDLACVTLHRRIVDHVDAEWRAAAPTAQALNIQLVAIDLELLLLPLPNAFKGLPELMIEGHHLTLADVEHVGCVTRSCSVEERERPQALDGAAKLLDFALTVLLQHLGPALRDLLSPLHVNIVLLE